MDTLHGYPTDEWLTADNGEEHPLELALTSVLSITQAQRLAKIALMRNRFEGTGVLEMNLSSYVMQPKDIFEFTFPLLGWTNHLLEVSKVDFVVDEDQDSGAQCIRVRYTVVETDPSIYDWTPNSEELTVYDVPASPNQAPASPTPPTNLTLNSGPSVAQINPDGTVNNLIVVGWDTPLDNLAIGIQIQYRVSGTTVWSPAPSQSITLNSSWISNVIPGATYDVRIGSYRANGQVSTWVEQDGYTVINTPTDLGTLAAQLPVLQQSVGTTVGEMLLNGNFSQGLTDWATQGIAPFIDTTQFKLGTQSVRSQGGALRQSVALIGGHTYLLQCWVMTDGSVVGGGSQGAGLVFADPTSQLTIQKVNGSAVNAASQNPGVLLPAVSAAPWTLLQITVACATGGSYMVGLTDDYGGSAVNAHAWFDGVSLTDTTGGADVTASQPIVTAASSESIIPNGSFQLGNMNGWIAGGFTFGSDGNGYRIYAPAETGTGASTPAFQVIPGAKYRLVYTCYCGSGANGIYFRLGWSGKTVPAPANIVPLSGQTPDTIPGYTDFASNATITTTPTGYYYDWVAPAGAYYASMLIYDVAGSDLACQKLECFPYVAVGQYGADVTGGNTSNDTSHVDGVPSSTIAQVVPTGYELFINNGSREYSFQAV